VTTNPLQILVVDDNRSAADALARVLRKSGDVVETCYDGATAIQRIRERRPDVVLTDLKMEPVDGMAVLTAAREHRPPIEVVVFTAYGDVEVAVEAMRLGARDFLTKPVTVEQVQARLDPIRTDGPPNPSARAQPDATGGHFVARAPSSRQLLDTLKKTAAVPSPVWIEGELGAGRGHAALALHHMSSSDGPFTVRDLGRDESWPTSGTVLLPNVDDLPEDLQRRLHRSLQHVPAGVRLVATSQPFARRRVAEGTLRPELYYALGVIVVGMPPLRDRQEDILPMLDQALDRFSDRYGRPRPTVTDSQKQRLQAHAWPGNVRELVNLAERAVVMGSSALEIDAIEAAPPGLPNLEPGFSLPAHLEGVERAILEEAMRLASGDRTQAGKLLGLERNTLRYKLNKYDLLH